MPIIRIGVAQYARRTYVSPGRSSYNSGGANTASFAFNTGITQVRRLEASRARLRSRVTLEPQAPPAGVIHEGEANLNAVATWAADGAQIFGGDLAVTAVATFTSDGTFVFASGTATFTGVAVGTFDGAVGLLGETSVAGVATFTSDGTFVHNGEASLTGVATLVAEHSGIEQRRETRIVSTGRRYTGGAYLSRPRTRVVPTPDASAVLETVATFTSDGVGIFVGEASATGVATFTSEGEVTEPAGSSTRARRRSRVLLPQRVMELLSSAGICPCRPSRPSPPTGWSRFLGNRRYRASPPRRLTARRYTVAISRRKRSPPPPSTLRRSAVGMYRCKRSPRWPPRPIRPFRSDG